MAKRALCVGINDYPGTHMDLAGCVNDARDWQAVLRARGYQVDCLLDADATAARIKEALRALLAGSTAGDSLVFTFAGHGSWLPDDQADEPDARDEMMCPYDVMQSRYVLDDDLHAIFSTKGDGARLFVISDSCHSGSVVRHAPPPVDRDAVPLRARFLPPYALVRGNVRAERAIDRATHAPAPTKHRYPAVLFSGCRDSEFSYDTSFNGRPNGAFTRTAVDALSRGGIATPLALHEAVRETLPSPTFPQSPQLTGSRDDKMGPLF